MEVVATGGIHLTTPTLCGHATSILQRIAIAAGAGGSAIFCPIESEDTMSLKMCELQVHGLTP